MCSQPSSAPLMSSPAGSSPAENCLGRSFESAILSTVHVGHVWSHVWCVAITVLTRLHQFRSCSGQARPHPRRECSFEAFGFSIAGGSFSTSTALLAGSESFSKPCKKVLQPDSVHVALHMAPGHSELGRISGWRAWS